MTVLETMDAEVAFLTKAETAFRALFEKARAKNELQFALALTPEMRGTQDAGWNTAFEAITALEDFIGYLKTASPSRVNVRIALGFYCHLAEAAGFYEVPKNLLRISQGEPFVIGPFGHLVKEHSETGKKIAPNANRVMKHLVGHASVAGFPDLADVFRDAFDADVRNGYAHARGLCDLEGRDPLPESEWWLPASTLPQGLRAPTQPRCELLRSSVRRSRREHPQLRPAASAPSPSERPAGCEVDDSIRS